MIDVVLAAAIVWLSVGWWRATELIGELRTALDGAQNDAIHYHKKFNDLAHRWNNLVNRINRAGGESIFDRDKSQLSESDIKRILQLCHPDRHNNSDLSVEITQKLLKLRDNARAD